MGIFYDKRHKVVNSINNASEWDLNEYNPIYVKDCKAIVKRWANFYEFVDARNSMLIGSDCYSYHIRNVNFNLNSINIVNNFIHSFDYNLGKIMQFLNNLQLNNLEKIKEGVSFAAFSGELNDSLVISVSILSACKTVTPWGLEDRRERAKNKPLFITRTKDVKTIIKPDDYVIFCGVGDNKEDRKFSIGDNVEVDSYNLHYDGCVTAIKQKYVETYGCPNGLKRNTYENILWRNSSVRQLKKNAEYDVNWHD